MYLLNKREDLGLIFRPPKWELRSSFILIYKTLFIGIIINSTSPYGESGQKFFFSTILYHPLSALHLPKNNNPSGIRSFSCLRFLMVIFFPSLIPFHHIPMHSPIFGNLPLTDKSWPLSRNRRRWKNKKVRTKPHISRNPILGAYNTLVQELRTEDAAAFKKIFRMDRTCFDELLEMVKPLLQKQDTNMRKNIPVGEKLALTLRYLETGEFICSALFTSIMAKRASLGDRISPKTSCCSQYRELFYILAAYDKYYTSLICLK